MHEHGPDGRRKRLAARKYDLEGLCRVTAGQINNGAVHALKSGEDETEHGYGLLPARTVPQEGQVSDVKVQVGPQVGVILRPHLVVLLAPGRVDDNLDTGDRLDIVEADNMVCGAESDDAVPTDGGYGDAMQAAETRFPGEPAREEKTADGLADLGLVRPGELRSWFASAQMLEQC